MGERKVLNRYIPPDFDPSIIPRIKRDRTKLIEVRTMLPFSMRCSTCGEYMYKGKKFNSRMERVEGEAYLGIKKYRFYIKCSVCSSEITFKTDPKNSDYECESGATRNFELWRENEKEREAEEIAREEEEKIDSMRSLENRTLDSKLEMDVLDGLDEIRAINQRHERVDTEKLLGAQRARAEMLEKLVTDEFDTEIANVQFLSKSVRSCVDSDDEDVRENKATDVAGMLLGKLTKDAAEKKIDFQSNYLAGTVVKKKRKVGTSENTDDHAVTATASSSQPPPPPPPPTPSVSNSCISSLLASYGSDSD